MKYLIVDDHALVRSALSMMLLDRDPSAEVLTAGDVPTTLELIGREGETADLLILDLNLPGVEGTELMEEIVRRQPMLKILVLSGLTDRGRIMRVLQLGAAGFVPKSLDTDMLTNAIEFVLRGGVFIPSKLLAESQREGFFPLAPAPLEQRPQAHRPPEGRADASRQGRAHQAHLPRAQPLRGHREDPRRRHLPHLRRKQPNRGPSCSPPRGLQHRDLTIPPHKP